MYGLDMINTSVLGALGCDMNTFLRYFPAAETMYIVPFVKKKGSDYSGVVCAWKKHGIDFASVNNK